MIRVFKSRKMLFSPVSFLNSVARWILGVHSQSGTLRITNTATPAEGKGPSFDVDCHEVAKKIDDDLKANYIKSNDRTNVGPSLKWNGRQLDVDTEWLNNKMTDLNLSDDSDAKEIGTPTSCGSFATNEVTQEAATLWEIGGEGGAELLVIFKAATTGAYTRLYASRLTFSKEGLLTKIEAAENCGERITG